LALQDEGVEAAIAIHRAQRIHADAQLIAVAQKFAGQRDRLQVRTIDLLGLVVGVADIVANQKAFSGQFAAAGHGTLSGKLRVAIRLIFRLFQPERAGFISKQGLWVKAGSATSRLAPRPKITNINRHLQDTSGLKPMKAAALAITWALALLLAAPSSGWAAGGAGAETSTQPASRLEMAMTLYAGGITMGTMSLDASLRGSD